MSEVPEAECRDRDKDRETDLSMRACYVRGCERSCVAGYPWFAPGDIKLDMDGTLRPCPHQVIFLVLVREALKWMRWPAEPSGYIDQPSKPSPKSDGAFVDCCMIAAPFLQRFARVEISRKGRQDIIKLDNQLREGRKYDQLSVEASRVIVYLQKRRLDGYAHFVRQRVRV